jgi:hypothetical protein
MFHHRLTLTGTDEPVNAAGAELLAMAATPVGSHCFITCGDKGVEMWHEFVENHPRVRLSIDLFDEFEDEFVQAVVTRRGSTVLSRRSVLPEQFGCFDEDGDPLPQGLLKAAGRTIAGERLAHDVGTLSSHLDDALTMAKALGVFCTRVESSVFDEPRESDIAAVREIAVFAWWIAVAEQGGGTSAELEFDHALALTQAVVQAGREELWDKPGHASWMSWVEAIIAGASEVIETASAPQRSPEGHLSFAARSLLTTCVQTVALFAQPQR